MTNFKSNFSELRMLSNRPVIGEINEKTFEINYPTLLTLEDNDVSFLINFLEKTQEELKKIIDIKNINTHYKMIVFFVSAKEKIEGVKEVSNSLNRGLKYFVPDLEIENGFMKIKGEYINEKFFNELTNLIFKMLDKERILIEEDDDPFTKREKEAKIRAKRIKQNSKKEKKGSSLENMLASVIYEFPQYTLEDLFSLNLYTTYYLFGYVGKIANYEVSKIAAGNGLMKKGKHKYFVE